MDTIGVNCGHTISGAGSGAVGIISESEHTRKVGYEFMRLVNESGNKAVDCTVNKANSATEALSLIVQQANRVDLDWFISIHFNAGGGNGVEAYTYEGRQYKDAVDVCSNISKLGFKNRGVKAGNGLYVVRRTKAKSMLIEVCFVDTNDANLYLKLGYKAIAKAIFDALIQHVNTPTSIPLKMKYDCPAIRIKDNSLDLVKYFYRNDNITARGEVNGFYKLDINGTIAYISKESTTNR